MGKGRAPLAAVSSPANAAATGARRWCSTQEQARAVDEELMGPLGFSVDQLMELAGLSVASAVAAEYAPPRRVLVLAGPGNNGGDGLVAARHLHHFGYSLEVCVPKPTDRPLYNGLVTQVLRCACVRLRRRERGRVCVDPPCARPCDTQLHSLGLPFVDAAALLGGAALRERCDLVIDALFGFSFKGEPRPPFDALLEVRVCVCVCVRGGRGGVGGGGGQRPLRSAARPRSPPLPCNPASTRRDPPPPIRCSC